jgi:PKD domain-containing protein/A-macroglobulin complement component
MVLTILLVLLISTTFTFAHSTTRGVTNAQLSRAPSSSLDGALQWLAGNQSSNGSYGAYEEGLAATAAYALWLNNSISPKAALSYSWLATQLNRSSSWFWGTEADVPGAVLYSIASSANLHLIDTTSVAANLLQLQQSHSGFEGYYDSTASQIATSSVDTDMALLGLINAKEILPQNQTDAIQYLRSVQNPDGSFNLTKTLPFDPLDFLGPDPISITAMTVLALKSANITINDPYVASALTFLKNAASTGFNRHVYAAAIADLAFKAYDQPDDAISSTLFILSQQNCDGGFSDTSRSTYPQSNALDTGWVATALQTSFPGENGVGLVNIHRVNCSPVADFHINPSTPSVGTLVHFDAKASHDPDNDQLSYKWTFGDGYRAEGLDPTHTYSSAGNFTITLTVIDSGTNPGPLSDTKSLSMFTQPTTVQESPGLPIIGSAFWIVIGVVGLLAIIGGAFYLGRKTARNSTTSRA